jgi:hypothetical protein
MTSLIDLLITVKCSIWYLSGRDAAIINRRIIKQNKIYKTAIQEFEVIYSILKIKQAVIVSIGNAEASRSGCEDRTVALSKRCPFLPNLSNS